MTTPLGTFEKYMELLYTKKELWEEFERLCREEFRQYRQDENYFAYKRDIRNVDTWAAFLDNMGGGVSIRFYYAAAALILCYRDNGHDIDAELAKAQKKYKRTFIPLA